MIYRWLVGVALLFAILLLMLPNKDEKSVTKIASASMLACTLDYRDQVGRQLARKEAVTVIYDNKCQNVIATVEVGERGDIVITGKEHQLMLTLSPLVSNGKVHWSCQGEPLGGSEYQQHRTCTGRGWCQRSPRKVRCQREFLIPSSTVFPV